MQEKSSTEPSADNQANNTTGFVRGLRIFLGAILMFVGAFLVIVTVFVRSGKIASRFQDTNTRTITLALAVIAMLVAVLAANRIYRKGVAAAALLTGPLHERLNVYRSAFIKYTGICDLAAVFCILLFALTADFRLFIPLAVGALALLRIIPSRQKLGSELNLSQQEMEQL